jgi:hypothetical protein
MKEKMIDGFTTPLAHITPIHHNQTSLAKIIQSENLSKRSHPHKEVNSERDFNLPNAVPQERRTPLLVPIQRKGKHTEERANLKKLPLGRNPTNPIQHRPPSPPHDARSHTIYRRKPSPPQPPNPELLGKNEHSNELPHSKSAYNRSSKPLCFLQYDTTQGKTPSTVEHHTKYHAKN